MNQIEIMISLNLRFNPASKKIENDARYITQTYCPKGLFPLHGLGNVKE